jgi:hypothetical protein
VRLIRINVYSNLKPLDLNGRRFGKLVVQDFNYLNTKGSIRWLCRCDCGRECYVAEAMLRTKGSCGCPVRPYQPKEPSTRDPDRSRILTILNGMKQRGNNPKSSSYANYGGRGIKVCKEWVESSTKFYYWAKLSGYKQGLQIDRVDNWKGYEPNNCRWVPARVNIDNQRKRRMIEFRGEFATIMQWSERSGLTEQHIRDALARGETPEAILGPHIPQTETAAGR